MGQRALPAGRSQRDAYPGITARTCALAALARYSARCHATRGRPGGRGKIPSGVLPLAGTSPLMAFAGKISAECASPLRARMGAGRIGAARKAAASDIRDDIAFHLAGHAHLILAVG